MVSLITELIISNYCLSLANGIAIQTLTSINKDITQSYTHIFDVGLEVHGILGDF